MVTVTQWFDHDVFPERVGVYQRHLPGNGIRYAYYDGERWCGYADTPHAAWVNRVWFSIIWNAKWRGLATRPSAQKDGKEVG